MAAKRSSHARRKPAPNRGETAEFERLLERTGRRQRYFLRLFISGNSQRSTQAIANVRSLCEEYLAGRYELEVVDIYQQPGVLAAEQIIAAPTLVKKLPMPLKRIVGDLSNRNQVIVGLALAKPLGAKSRSTKWAMV